LCKLWIFSPSETLASVCERNEDLPVNEVIATILAGHEADKQMYLEIRTPRAMRMTIPSLLQGKSLGGPVRLHWRAASSSAQTKFSDRPRKRCGA
jgi:hypothetical protein